MRNNIPRQILLFAVVLLTIAADTADAKREHRWGKHDTAPHFTSHDGMKVLGDEVNDLGMGPLQTFVVQPGETVEIVFEVYEDKHDYILGSNILEAEGVLHGSTPLFTADLAETYWKYQPSSTYTTMLDDFYRGPHLFTFEMMVDVNTPADFYLMEAMLVGKGRHHHKKKMKWHQAEKFYVEVRDIPEPSSMTLLVTLGAGLFLLPVFRLRNCGTAQDRSQREPRPDARHCRGIRGWPWLRNKKMIRTAQKHCHTKTAIEQGQNRQSGNGGSPCTPKAN